MQKNCHFSKKEALAYGWGSMKKNFWFFAQIIIIMLAAVGITGLLGNYFKDRNPVNGALWSVISLFIQFAISAGAIAVILKIYDGGKAKIKDILVDPQIVIRYIIASVLYSLIVIAGFILLIFPGFMWMMKYQMFQYFIIDKKMKPIEALKESGKITQGSRWNLFFFFILAALMNLAGMLVFGVGLFVTMPVTAMSFVWIYKKLLARQEK
jgi:uncharacterized membrane protein